MPHGMLDPWFQRDKSRRLKAIRNSIYWWLFERRALNSADALLFTCEEELRLARTTFGGYRPKREINIGYGIAEPPVFEMQMREAFQGKCPELGNNRYLLFLGRIHPKKGVDLLIRAYAEVLKTDKLKTPLPDLVIAGPGWETSYGRQMRQLMDAANCEILPENAPRIHSVGMLEGDSKLGALFGCEAFVLPSHQENFGISVVEALACGKLVLISNKVNIWREIVEAGAGIVGDDTVEGIKNLLASWGRIRLTGEMPESLPNNGRDISADTTFDLEFSFRIRESSLKCFDKNFLITRLANNIKKGRVFKLCLLIFCIIFRN